ncbi:MAG: MarR family winged helix-turn-helix transcriptional regulator [Acutalibacter sp.]
MEPPKQAQERQLPPHFSRELGRAITFLSRGRKRFMAERLRELGFSGAMYLILLHLEHHPGATQDSIANHLFIDKCNVARRTKKLETLGYLYRETNQNDRRENHLYLTDKGRELVPTIREYLGQWGRSITADLTDTECAELLALLTKMTGQDRK